MDSPPCETAGRWLNTEAMPASGLRVIVVEDSAFTRTTLCGALRDAGVDVVGDAGSASEGVTLTRALAPDAVLVDLDLGAGPSGADLAAELRASRPNLGIVILTSYEDPRLTGRNVDHLPSDVVYLVKGALDDATQLSHAIVRAVAAAGAPSRPGSPIPKPTGDVAKLTDTQIEVVRLVAEGLSNAEIARQRFISETSVERIIMRAARELGIPTTSASNRRVLLTRAYLRMSGAAPADG